MKLKRLKEILSGMGSALIAYSGGVDSTFLLKVAHDVLGNRIIAVTAKSLIHPLWETEEAKKMAERIGVKHLVVETDELSNPQFTTNPPERCYRCKKGLLSTLTAIAKEHGLNHILDGSNYDDTEDFRPGMKAVSEFGVRSPLLEAGLRKEEIRKLSKRFGLSTWNRPAYACLATRFPFGTLITKEGLDMVNNAEEFMRSLGIEQLRVRHHGHIARIEVLQKDIPKILKKDVRNKIISNLKKLGYNYVTIDLEGYRGKYV